MFTTLTLDGTAETDMAVEMEQCARKFIVLVSVVCNCIVSFDNRNMSPGMIKTGLWTRSDTNQPVEEG